MTAVQVGVGDRADVMSPALPNRVQHGGVADLAVMVGYLIEPDAMRPT